jgi:ergothioneine biosynthesis protein EgtB
MTEPVPDLADRYLEVRALTEAIAAPLSAEDQTAQSMPDVSPTKWHRAHTTWFFEEFLLGPHLAGYQVFDPAFRYLFNSYYEAVGSRHPRAQRGVITRPGIDGVAAYRRHVDAAMGHLLTDPAGLPADVADLVELGLHHEQQHQELALMDIKHVLAANVTDPVYRADPEHDPTAEPGPTGPPTWFEHPGGAVEIGHATAGFAFDNEQPRHCVHLVPFALATRPVTCGEVLAFMADDGYRRAELWLSDGWATASTERWEAPLYWHRESGDRWSVFTLSGRRPVDPREPVVHVSYYEADAIARWSGARLPTEAEWEAVAAGRPATGSLLDLDAGHGHLHPRAAPTAWGAEVAPTVPQAPPVGQLFGDVWEWTASAYLPYPGFRTAPGAVGEYNGKFMVNQHVLRGGSCITPTGHVRATYRNFFPPAARWAFSGLRLARDLDRPTAPSPTRGARP